MTQQEIQELAGHRQVPAWVIKLVGDCLAKEREQEPVAWESLLGAIARGWCYEENANKIMDSELALAIAKEVSTLFNIKGKA